MDRWEFLSNTKKKEIFKYLLGRHVQNNGYDVQYVNANADVENVKCARNKLACVYLMVTTDNTGIQIFIMYFYLSDREMK